MPPKGSALSTYLVKALVSLGLLGGLFLLATVIWASAAARNHRYLFRLKVSDGPAVRGADAELRRAADVLSARIEALRRTFKLSRWSVRAVGPDSIELQIRTRSDPARAIAWLTMVGSVEFRLLHPRDDILDQVEAGEPPPQYEVKLYRQKQYILSKPGELETIERRFALEREPVLAISQFEKATIEKIGLHKMTVLTFHFSPEDARAFGPVTALNAGRRMAMLIDAEMYFPPKTIESAIGSGIVQVRGFFYMPPLRKLVKVLNCGSLPGPLEELSHTVD